MVLQDLFFIYNGISSTSLQISDDKLDENSVAYIRPSKSWRNVITGYIDKNLVNSKHIYPADTLFISTNGEGSHSYSYLSPIEFVPNSDVSVLIPKKKMDIRTKLFYSMCITANRFKFSYGRKPKGNKLANLEIPSVIPAWVSSIEFPNYGDAIKGTNKISVGEGEKLLITDLFHISYGNKLDLNKMTIIEQSEANSAAFVSRTARNLGISAFVSRLEKKPPYKAGLITVALGGSILSSFVQPYDFYTAQNIVVLIPKREMSIAEKVFYCMCIEKNKFRYTAFGREANRTLKTLELPAHLPSWIEEDIVSDKISLTR